MNFWLGWEREIRYHTGNYQLPHMPSAPCVVMTNGADGFTLYSNFLPINRYGGGNGVGDAEVVRVGAVVYLFGQAIKLLLIIFSMGSSTVLTDSKFVRVSP